MTLKGQSTSHRFSIAYKPYISKSIQDNHRVTRRGSRGGQGVGPPPPQKKNLTIYGSTIVRRGSRGGQGGLGPPFTKSCIRLWLLLMMDRKSYMDFHLAPLSLTWRGQIKVMHISLSEPGCNLVTLADTARLIINDG